MNYDELSPEQLINKLNTAGCYPHPDLINTICERRSQTEPLILNLFREAYHDNWPQDDDPRWYRFIHAGKFLLSWQNPEALPIFAQFYSDDEMQDWCEWFEEDLFHFGPVAIPHLQQVVTKEYGDDWHYGQSLSGSILTKIATYYPETREEITAVFRAQLPSQDKIPELSEAKETWGNWAMELGQLADDSSRDLILALADAHLLSYEMFDRQHYLQEVNRDFKLLKPSAPYDIRDDYRQRYESHQETLRQQERERERQRKSRVRPAKLRSGPKIGQAAMSLALVAVAKSIRDVTAVLVHHKIALQRITMSQSSVIVQRLWNYCTVLRDDGLSYGDYVEQLTYLLFLTMDDERRLSVVTTTEQAITANLARAERLRQAILHRAFTGQLVTQQP